ncbi:MAG TPA: hypothetical protein VN961_20970 [Streptosporangiaceae bacterium]|nr:hypothetical protein [Streptosporangiaceae bacterium]
MPDDVYARARRIARLIKPLRVKPGARVDLARDYDPRYKAGVTRKKEGVEILQAGKELLAEYQARLAAQERYGVLMCLQSLDAGGKDGTVRHVMSGVNPQGVHVSSFQVPSAEELNHDYLWRCNARLPARGEIAIFNRSHYEEVLVLRVHPESLERERLPEDCTGKGIWQRRYAEINDWERYLAGNGIRVLKLFLNLSKEEQRVRFQAHRPAGEELEVLGRRRQGAPVLGRLPASVLADAVGHEYAVGALVCDTGGPQVVRQTMRGRGARAHAHRA